MERVEQKMDQHVYEEYIAILKEELVPALGCTEPIAIAYAAAKAREILGKLPEEIVVSCSGNIIKNVKAVIVPTTGDLKGIETSAILGAVGGNAEKKLEVLVDVTDEDLKKNGQVIFSKEMEADSAASTDRTLLNLKDIYEFAQTVKIDEIKDLIDRQLAYNMSIAKEGLTKSYGANVGATILKYYGDDVRNRAKALPAAGSDARMNGCVLPVMINSGSGNQGMTVSLPVAVFADYLFADKEKEYRALVLSNLVAIYQKNELGKLSAYCGAVSAATGAGAGIAYLHGADFDTIAETITNTLANVSGIVCDGAKASCAAKIASSVDAAIMAYYMAAEHRGFQSGEGLVKKDVEATIKSFGRMGREGMRSTDVEILKIMLEP